MPHAQNGILVITQARAGGTRYPGKMLQPLLGQAVLLWHLERLTHIRTPHTLVVASPPTAENEAIARLCVQHGYRCERPPCDEQDVLGRFAWIADHYHAQQIVHVCADCLTIDPVVVDQLLASHFQACYTAGVAYTGTAAEWPDGCDVEVITAEALAIAHHEATLPYHREHVGSYLYDHPEQFSSTVLSCPLNLHDVCWSLDTPNDLVVLEQLLKATILRTGLHFTWQDLWATMLLQPVLFQQILARPSRNSAYVAQVARETGVNVQMWEQLRYGVRDATP